MAVAFQRHDPMKLAGLRFPRNSEIFTDNIMQAMNGGYYEIREGKQIDAIIQDEEVILEIGGGIGFISTLCGRNPKTKSITTYEANPKLTDYMREVHELNGVKVDVHNAVLLPYPQRPTIEFYVRNDFWASSLSPVPAGYKEEILVETRDFQKVLNQVRPTMLVIDIEGGESLLFETIDLTGVRKVFIEIHQEVLGRRGIKQLFDQFSARNFAYDQWHSEGAVVLFSHLDR